MIGQHVIIDLNAEQTQSTALMLPAAFLIEENGNYYVWAANANDRIEKRRVEIGAFDEMTESYEILSGLTAKDRIAFPDETVHAGMRATETAFTDPNEQSMPEGGDSFLPDNGMSGSFEEPAFDLPEEDFVDTVDFGG